MIAIFHIPAEEEPGMHGSKCLTYFPITLSRHIPFAVRLLLFRNHPPFHIVCNLLPIERFIVRTEISVTTATYTYISLEYVP
jgi:hypothetical protein